MAYAARHPSAARRRQRRLRLHFLGELGFDHADQIAVMHAAALAHDGERVERIAIARGVDLRLGDVEAGALEVARDAGEQRFPVARVDHHLQAFAEGREAGLDDRPLGLHAVVKIARMPGDFLRVMPKEVSNVELRPQPFLDAVGQCVKPQQPRRFRLLLGQGGVPGEGLTCEYSPGSAKQVFQKLGFPGVPDLRAGAAHVGDGQKIERHQAPLAAHPVCKRAHHLRVVRVLLLRRAGHRKVMLDQEGDEIRVLGGKPVRAAEAAHIVRAELGMICASTFGDVVVQRRHIEQPAPLEPAHELAAKRKFMRQLGHGEAAQVPDHHQDVLVDRVDVEQVVLHLSDDAAELRQVATQDAVLVHAPELVHDAARLLQEMKKEQPRPRIAAEFRIDAPPRPPQRAQRRCGHAAQLRVLHHQQEALDEAGRLPPEQILVDDFQQLAAHPEALVQPAGRVLRLGQQARFEVLQQDRV